MQARSLLVRTFESKQMVGLTNAGLLETKLDIGKPMASYSLRAIWNVLFW